nr:MAG TPA: hypothetical protein [Caudoviricetes sp.]DAW05626.1 MAG TPA: hypothetical protein [Caudoviricetes sp.]
MVAYPQPNSCFHALVFLANQRTRRVSDNSYQPNYIVLMY